MAFPPDADAFLPANTGGHALPQGERPLLNVISAQVIERLESGRFVPKRTESRRDGSRGRDRREAETPLNTCRHSIRYEPAVFHDRSELMLRLAKQLNRSQVRCIHLTGGEGVGKTSVARGLVELMGGGKEQLLWFELMEYQQVDAVCSQLLQQLVFYIAGELQVEVAWNEIDWHCSDAANRKRLLAWVGEYLHAIGELPLVLVLDRADFLYTSNGQLTSPALAHVLQWWLELPNTKLLILSRQALSTKLPLPPQAMVQEALQPFDNALLQRWIHNERSKAVLLPSEASKSGLLANLEGVPSPMESYIQLLSQCEGLPWLMNGLRNLYQQQSEVLPLLWQQAETHRKRTEAQLSASDRPLASSQAVLEAIVRHWQKNLHSDDQELLFPLLALMQHPLPACMLGDLIANLSHPQAIDWLVQNCHPAWIRSFISVLNEPQALQQRFITPLLQRPESPQLPLSATPLPPRNTTWFLLFNTPLRLQQTLLAHIPVETCYRWHQRLAGWYDEQSKRSPAYRLIKSADTIQLERLFRHHRDAARQLQQQLQPQKSDLSEWMPYLPQSRLPAYQPQKPKLAPSLPAASLMQQEAASASTPSAQNVAPPQEVKLPFRSTAPQEAKRFLEQHPVGERVAVGSNAHQQQPLEGERQYQQAMALMVQAKVKGNSPTVALEQYKQAYHLLLTLQRFEQASEVLNTMAQLFWEHQDLERVRYCLERALLIDAQQPPSTRQLLNHRDWAFLLADEGYPETGLQYLRETMAALCEGPAGMQLPPPLQIELWVSLGELASELISAPALEAGKAGDKKTLAEAGGLALQWARSYFQQALYLAQGQLSSEACHQLQLRLDALSIDS